MSTPVLRVDDLHVGYDAGEGDVEIVAGVSFELQRGEALGLAGESGCGKSTTALAVLQLLAPGLRRLSGTVDLRTDAGVVHIHRRTERGMRELRWAEISLVVQGALNALDPVQRISRQIGDAIRVHRPETDRAAVRARVRELLDRVGIGADRADQYPHEFSDGMRQRVMIALALACDPEVIVADEPTTALDVMTQAQVLALLEELRRELGLALLLITHDLAVIAETCERVAVMYAGRIVETGPTPAVFAVPQHPYTQRLLGAFPLVGSERALPPAIPGTPPDPSDPPSGCRFHPRCHLAREACEHGDTALRSVGDDHESACLFAPLQQTAAAGGLR
jgi:oligopeptide/dipeptide ABC transporter ATP-binding protein